MLQNFSPRLYQQTILASAATKNTLVVLPTGLGKTGIALLLATQRLIQYPQSKILLVAPTKPLCEQHLDTFRKHLAIEPEKIVLFTGSVTPVKREKLWKDATIIISTPQGLENDIINRRIDLKNVSCLIIDEAHHATGDYPYVWLASQYEKNAQFPRILALTASPGTDLESIKELCKNLYIEKIEVRTEQDHDVAQYVQDVELNWVSVEFPAELKTIQSHLVACKTSKLTAIMQLGHSRSSNLSKGELLGLQQELQGKLAQEGTDFDVFKSLSLLAEALKIDHAIELLETQGAQQTAQYLEKLQTEARTSNTKAVKNLVQDEHFKAALYLSQQQVVQATPHPKIVKLQEIVTQTIQENATAKAIVFTQFRDSAEVIIKILETCGITSHIFVGQAKKNGLGFSQKQQKEILERFRAGAFSVLVATSVAEEGLDIPKVDKVIFYEPIPSAIRSIQRRGRTGRLEKGEVCVLMTKGTRDEVYRWAAHHKEKRMYRHLDELRKNIGLILPTKDEETKAKSTEKSLMSYAKPSLTHPSNLEHVSSPSLTKISSPPIKTIILADHREKSNRVVKELLDLNVHVTLEQLDHADYVLSGRVAVELKQVPDFVASLIDGRIMDQLRDLKRVFEKAVLVIEGEEEIYNVRNVHPNALRGLLASIILDFAIPIMYTKNAKETAVLLAIMAKREQEKGVDFSLHAGKPKTLSQQQEYVVSSFPGIGSQMAGALLQHFGSIEKIINASKKELAKVEGIGVKTAEKIREIIEKEYEQKETK
ncbi:DEAD/DEAH box helicase [Candidatus Woesearchaeota archaeon]|nr:DEAD/DEAH box helicase [Candidatus Woesearchaeota archaeon]